jgi:Cu+-exporting ATPase
MNVAAVAPVVPATPQAEAPPAQVSAAPSKSDIPDKQVVVMRIDGFSYIPNRFTVMQGVPVEWRIDASEAAACGRFLLAPGLGIRKLLSDRSTTMITFVPQQAGEFGFNCGMGMMTPGSKFTVVPNARG